MDAVADGTTGKLFPPLFNPHIVIMAKSQTVLLITILLYYASDHQSLLHCLRNVNV